MVLTSERVNKVCNGPTSTKAVTLDDPQDGAEPRDGPQEMTENTRPEVDYAAGIEKVKERGWYWGPISGAVAERLVQNESDGSFLVRDSSDEHHIFSLTFKLNGEVRHVRIEHHGGNFSFGFGNRFQSKTIIEFVENAVAHSRSGRYLFFLNQRPMLGPLRVQLLHPVSRFKSMPSLQHMCRYTIFNVLCQRRDLIDELPLPPKLKVYLDVPNYLVELYPDPPEPKPVGYATRIESPQLNQNPQLDPNPPSDQHPPADQNPPSDRVPSPDRNPPSDQDQGFASCASTPIFQCNGATQRPQPVRKLEPTRTMHSPLPDPPSDKKPPSDESLT